MLQQAAYMDRLLTADITACRDLLRNGSRSFYAASFLLPRRVRDPATALYAFCRLADDAVDIGEGGTPALDRLRERLDRAYRGDPFPIAADRAFSDVAIRFAIPRALPEALIDGFAWDSAGRLYETEDELLDYCARVAGTVGAMMSLLMGQRDQEVLARACDLGLAMQLTNIARDVGEDARNGRLYLPRSWMREAGLDPDAWLKHPAFDERLGSVVRRLLDVADEIYERADAGIGQLPADCRPGITAARLLYAEIGKEVARGHWDSVTTRAVVPGKRKLQLLRQALTSVVRKTPWKESSGSQSVLFLMKAAAASLRPEQRLDIPIAWWDFRKRVLLTLDIFERSKRRDHDHNMIEDDVIEPADGLSSGAA